MKNKKKLLILSILGGIILMAYAANGFRLPGDYTPKNRTTEQYDFEGTFNPMFDFLEQKEKGFTRIKRYSSYISIINASGEEEENYKIVLDTKQNPIIGTYKIEKGGSSQEVPVTYSNGHLQYEGELNPPFDEEIFNLSINKSYFESLDVKEIFKSAETELSDIIYKPENQSELFEKLVKKYNLPADTKLSVSLGYAHYNRYDILMNFESKQKTLQISTAITFEKGE